MKLHSLLFISITLLSACHSNQSQTIDTKSSSPLSDSIHVTPSIPSSLSKPLSLNITALGDRVPEDSNLSNDGIVFSLNEGDSGEILSMYDGGVIISINDSTIWFKDEPNPEDTSSIEHYHNENYDLTTNLTSLKKDAGFIDSNNIYPPIVGTLTLKAKDGRTIVKRIKGTVIQ